METNKQNILKDDERKYKIMYELSPEAIGILDINGIILDINGRVYDWLGYKPEEIIGKHILEVPYLTKESKIKIKEKFHERMTGKKFGSYEVDFIAKDGKRLVGRVLAAPIRDKNREIIGDIVMISDVTDFKRAEEALEKSEEKYRTFMETASDWMHAADENGYVTYVNESMARILGYSKKEMIGTHITKFLSKKEIDKNFQANWRKLLRTGKITLEAVWKTKNEKEIYGETKIVAVYDKNGNYIGSRGICRDISEQKKMEKELKESEKKYRFLFENVPVGIGFADFEGNILDGNKTMEEMTGYGIDELKNINLEITYVNPDDRKKLLKALQKNGQVYNREVNLKRKDGTIYTALLNIHTTEMDDRKVLITNARDITKEKQIERTKTEFVSLASHQLRTPLTSIKWYTEILLRDESNGKIDKQREYLENIYHSNKRLIELVNALLTASRIELGTFVIKPEPVNIIKIATDELNEFLPQITKKKLKIVTNYGRNLPVVNTDPNFIQIIFQNLLSNAIKYTPKRGSLEILIKKQGSNLLIKISDSGYGIPKNEQSQIFTKFFRANNIVEKDPDGTGLGLYIIKAIVEQSGGKIWFESEENSGTTFYVLIPSN